MPDAEDCYWIPLEGDYTYDGFVRMSKSENVLFLDDADWVNLPYAHQIQKARKEQGWSRRLDAGNTEQHGAWRCYV